jgi:hypothetical protein
MRIRVLPTRNHPADGLEAGQEWPGPSHGADVHEDGTGALPDGHLYQLVRGTSTVRERTQEITYLRPGARAYAFTFG